MKYYQMACDLGNSNTMCNFGLYYYQMHNYKQMSKYYSMACDLGNSRTMYSH